MKKHLLSLLLVLILSACSKQKEEILNVAEVAGPYIGDSMLYGPASCTKGEQNQKIKIIAENKTTLSVTYVPYDGFDGFVPFPTVQADIVARKNNIWYFKLRPVTTPDYKVWPFDNKIHEGIPYNIAIFPDGTIDAFMGYYDFKIPQGDQYFKFTGKKNN
ncbi:MAG: hypothetical protein WAT34_09290 [Chitinophagaceae bacterium]